MKAAVDCEPLFAIYGVDLVVTSGSEQYKHSALRSAHYRGDALDWRIKHIEENLREYLVDDIKKRVGNDFVVIHEGAGQPWEHIHIHWSPVFHGVDA